MAKATSSKKESIPLTASQKAHYLLMLAYSDDFRTRLRTNPRSALKSLGIDIPAGLVVSKPKKRLPAKKKVQELLVTFANTQPKEQVAAFERDLGPFACPQVPPV